MSTPLEIYNGAVRFMRAAYRLQPAVIADTALAQSQRVIESLSKMTFDQDAATELLDQLAEADPECHFTAEQKTSISEVVISGLSDGHKSAKPCNRAINKEQKHEHLFNYLPEILWSVLKSKDKLQHKFKHLVHFCVETIQLRNADAQTRRLMVAIVHEASGEDKDPDECFADFVEITEIFRSKRTEIRGEQSLSTFPEDPTRFIMRFPSAYPDDAHPVKCPLAKKDIRARANKTSIPCRVNNALVDKTKGMLAKTASSSQAMVPATEACAVDNTLKIVASCMSFLRGDVGKRGDDDMPNWLHLTAKGKKRDWDVDGSPSSMDDRVEDVTDRQTEQPLVGRKDPGCLVAHAAKKQGNDLASLRAQLKADLLKSAAGKPRDEENEEGEEEDGKRRREEDGAAEEVAPKPKGSCKKRPASAEPACGALPPSASAAVTIVHKRPAADLPPDAPAVDVLRAKRSVMRFEFALSQLRKKKKIAGRPILKAKPETAYYMGGRIYPQLKGKPVFRVFARKGDRHEHNIPYDPNDKKDKEAQWHLACSIMETDPREVIE